ncbi:MAG: hypothetical protein ABSD43_14105 [Terracidiphilus sp.]|jgi:hypothetical protein
MRKWGIVITLVYALIVVGLLVPVFVILLGGHSFLSPSFYMTLREACGWWGLWLPVAVVLSGQAILLFLSVDTSFQRLRPRSHIAVSCIAASMLFALLTFAGMSSLGAAVYSDKFLDRYWASVTQVSCVSGMLWALWGILFYLYFRNSLEITTRAVSWLLKGSVLELLVAVPCHILVRRRGDCSAPAATSFGIVTGIAVMLLSFGPSVLLLYKKRMDAYGAHGVK